jgi:hypothetical protein
MATERTGHTPASSREPVEEFSLPAEAVIEGYYINHWDGLRYPYGRSSEGFWAADEFGWAAWDTAADMTGAIESVVIVR